MLQRRYCRPVDFDSFPELPAHLEKSDSMDPVLLDSYNTAELDVDKLNEIGVYIDEMNSPLRKSDNSTDEDRVSGNSDHAVEYFEDTTGGVEVVKLASNDGELQMPDPILPSPNVEPVVNANTGLRPTHIDQHSSTNLAPERVFSNPNEDVFQHRGKLAKLTVLANNNAKITCTQTMPSVEEDGIEIVRAGTSTSSPGISNNNAEDSEFKHENHHTTLGADAVGTGTIRTSSMKLKNAFETEEMVSYTSTKKVTLLRFPNVLINDQMSTTTPETTEPTTPLDIDISTPANKEDPDGSYKGDSSHDINDAARKLLPLLSGSKDIADSELRSFIKLIYFSFPFLELKTPSPFEASQILLLAERLELPLYVADRYIDMAESTLEQRATNLSLQESNETERIEMFIRSLVIEIENLWEANGASSLTFVNDLEECTPFVNTTDSVEVDLNNGYANIDDVPSCHDEPWWKVVARLTGSSVDNKNHRRSIETMAEDARADTSIQVDTGKDPKCDVQRDIEHFWEKRRCPRTRVKVNKLIRTNNVPFFRGQKSQSGKFQHKLSKSMSLMSSFCPGSWSQKRDNCFYRGEFQHSIHPPKAINAVDAMFDLLENGTGNRDSYPFSISLARKSYAERTSDHSGFFDVDVYSLYDASQVRRYRHHLDALPWENRDVKQRFLFEPSISLSRNWFGCLKECPGNDKIHEPVCRPKSMEMPMRVCEWTEEWYKQPWITTMDSHISSSFGGDLHQSKDNQETVEEESWEEIPECGRLKNVKQKIGDRISRVTPDLTSILRRSRWRKKHFPHNTFPYK